MGHLALTGMLVEALRRAGAQAGGDRLIAALEEMNRVDMGGYEISFSRQNHDGSRFVDTGVVSQSGALRF